MLPNKEPQGILIVDDNPTNLEVLSESLIQEGFQVAVAIDGESALEQISYHPPELILLDVMMPGIDGFETCQRLKENTETHNIPVIFMTALSDSHNKVKGLSLGAIDYITKPFQQEEVLARVRVHLQVQTLTRTLSNQNSQLKDEIENRQQVEAQLVDANSALENLNHDLEQRVEERTQKLTEALQTVRQTQVQLIQQEKLSALGQLVAGIAHEINNPVNFIHGNLDHASSYAQDLLSLFGLYAQNYPNPTDDIKSKMEEIDVDFLTEDLPKLLSSMQVGTDRIRDIVLSLRIFSRLDEAEVKDVNIHEGIDSTLLILNSRIKGDVPPFPISVVKSYSELPKVKCYPGQLNQVCMNILSNAIDALEEEAEETNDGSWQPEICIRTELVGNDKVSIHIADNGPGVPEDLLEKIFDPFFTTKAVGKGTGLGMSISHEIISEKHNGTLTCKRLEPRGTQFTITIPTFQEVVESEGYITDEEMQESLIELEAESDIDSSTLNHSSNEVDIDIFDATNLSQEALETSMPGAGIESVGASGIEKFESRPKEKMPTIESSTPADIRHSPIVVKAIDLSKADDAAESVISTLRKPAETFAQETESTGNTRSVPEADHQPRFARAHEPEKAWVEIAEVTRTLNNETVRPVVQTEKIDTTAEAKPDSKNSSAKEPASSPEENTSEDKKELPAHTNKSLLLLDESVFSSFDRFSR
ncbi:MAG: response regulator [Cyanobacteria bacterium J06643_4]